MNYLGIEIVCPACRQDLCYTDDDRRHLRCDGCGREFPIVLEIPDLRLRPDPYISIESDRAKGTDLFHRTAGLTFEQTVDVYYRNTPGVPPDQARQFLRGLLSAPARVDQALAEWEARAGSDPVGASLLEIGCGTAALLIAASPQYRLLVGVDIAFRWLVAARRRLEEAGVNVPLICAAAEALPFRDGSFDRVVADSVVEHVWDQDVVMRECYRVMRPRGWLFVSTPNRFSIGPDPHVPIWMGGWWPRTWVDAYIRRRGGIAPLRRLVSASQLRALVDRAGFGSPGVFLPDVPARQRAHFGALVSGMIGVYDVFRRLPGGEWLLRHIGPLLHLVAVKPPVVPPARGTTASRG